MRSKQSNALRTVLAAAVPVGLVLSAAVVWQSTSAAFTATTDNAGNSWMAGNVALTNSSPSTKLFTTGTDGALKPGSTRSKCIRVDYAGDLPATVKLYVTTPAGGLSTLDQYLVMSVEQGSTTTSTTPVDPDCGNWSSLASAPQTWTYNTATASGTADQTKTMSDLKTNVGTYANGRVVGTAVTQGTSLPFKITYWVKDANGAQGTQSDATFTWEAQNN